MPAPQPTRLFHITAIANLPAIFAAGALRSKNGGAAAGINYQNIAHAGACRPAPRVRQRGLDWADVRPLIEAAFETLPDVEVRLFEPAGAPDPKTMEVRTKRPRMTAGRAAIVKVLDTYRELNYGLSKIEVQKLAYFLQEAGGPLDLPFVKHQYGPYSDTLRHALNTMEGHFIRGLGDGVVEAEIEPTEDALAEAEAFIAEKQHSGLAGQVDRVGRLIDGYQSSYGMELLASVHWVATHEADVRSQDDAVAAVHAWNDRKRHLMKREHIASAWKRLGDEGWLVAEQQPRAAL